MNGWFSRIATLSNLEAFLHYLDRLVLHFIKEHPDHSGQDGALFVKGLLDRMFPTAAPNTRLVYEALDCHIWDTYYLLRGSISKQMAV